AEHLVSIGDDDSIRDVVHTGSIITSSLRSRHWRRRRWAGSMAPSVFIGRRSFFPLPSPQVFGTLRCYISARKAVTSVNDGPVKPSNRYADRATFSHVSEKEGPAGPT
ncbi:hypothetical protein BHE74_00050124, partial [Ensete ventricosum]